MKTLRLLLLSALLFESAAVFPAHAQAYNRRMGRRATPQLQQAQTNAPPSPPQAPAPSPDQSAQSAPQPAVTHPLPVRVPPPPPDPEKVRAAKEEAERKRIEFQKKRAEEGSESAQYELGVRYLKGDGVEKDEATGRKWLEESAKNGFGPASKKLEDLNKPAVADKSEGGTKPAVATKTDLPDKTAEK